MNYIDLGIDNARFLCYLNIPHKLLISSNAARIEVDGAKPMVFASGEVKKKHLWFIRYAKNEVLKSSAYIHNAERLRKMSSQDVTYIMDGGRQPGVYTGLTEIDLNGAYWSAAYHLGYISKDAYCMGIKRDNEGKLKIPKKVRLIALGALARKRTIYSYVPDNKDYNYNGIEYDAHLGGVFFDCAKYIGDIMTKCVNAIQQSGIEQNPFCFFWFDALFVSTKLATLVKKFFILHSFAVKEKQIDSIEITHKGNDRVATCHMSDGTKKPFHLSLDFSCKIAFDDFVAMVKNNAKGNE